MQRLEAIDAGGEQSGVDGAGDGWMVGDLGDDRHAEDFGDVRRPEAPARFVDEDDAVVAVRLGPHEPPQSQVAGSPHDDVVLGLPGDLERLPAAAGVDDYQPGVS